MLSSVTNIHDWLGERKRANEYDVREVPLERLTEWRADAGTGNIVHRNGGFYSVEGIRVEGAEREVESWEQPLIRQPEKGILGLLVREFDGVPNFLMQAKMEPGNVNLVQLSPTVQATRSNYTRMHGGKSVPYLDHFLDPRPGSILADTLQSEQGSWFLAKQNRNMIVRLDQDVPVREDFHWVSWPLLSQLMRTDNIVNMDARSVLSTAAELSPTTAHRPDAPLSGTSPNRPLHTGDELWRWFAAERTRSGMRQCSLPLAQVRHWHHSGGAIRHEQGRYFTVTGVRATATNREVPGWDQPMIAPRSRGFVAILTRRFRGRPHLLLQARPEAGTSERVEIAPTVQCVPQNYSHLPRPQRPAFLEYVTGAEPETIVFDTLHSEEGGRFYHAVNRYMFIEMDTADDFEVPGNFIWMTPEQLQDFVRRGCCVNVEARSLLAGILLQG